MSNVNEEVLEKEKKSSLQGQEKRKLGWEAYYQLIREHINRSHDLIGQRTIWLAISQSFFFGGYAGIINAPKEAKSPLYAHQQDILMQVFPFIGMLACLIVFVGIIGRINYVNRLRREFEKVDPDDSTFNDYPPIDATLGIRRAEQFSTAGLPVMFILTWLLILFHQYQLF